MSKVADYYDQLAMTQAVPVRRVYLASDDPKVFAEMRAKYAEYEVIGDPNVAKMAAVATRYSDSSLNGIIMDIHFLSRSDYLVCTFSSQVCSVKGKGWVSIENEQMKSCVPKRPEKITTNNDLDG
ncbi:hypothetical protein LSTR_LSTR004051 [Laodelphax striatellus]|uniref:GT23 domain-containing protein n=1 Tax=Laodelphax striatellus TaxID=195883 RepID=A0A482WFF2_LAOST|nr:hypothetical protein LSTR_LSTR004051 [Laodelphax striatellus]